MEPELVANVWPVWKRWERGRPARIRMPEAGRMPALLAARYGFTEEELDYILNYDIKYRMGLGGGGGEESGDE